MKQKPITPYQRLLQQFTVFVDAVLHPTRVSMWRYPKAKLHEQWTLADLAERVAAAEQLGFNVWLRNVDGDLVVEYYRKPPARPWNV